MKKRKSIISLLIAVIVIGAAVLVHTAVSAQPGDAHDPLVTRRYVDARIDDVWNEIQLLRAENALLRAMVEAGGLPGIPGSAFDLEAMTFAVFNDVMLTFELMYGDMLRSAAAAGERALDFTILNPTAGQTLILENGSELIVRTGGAVVVTTTSGLADVTIGTDIDDGEAVGLNHLMICPRTDGRGVRFTADSWIMVRGAFTLE